MERRGHYPKLKCKKCGRKTSHAYEGYCGVSKNSSIIWLWKCKECGTVREAIRP